MPTRRTVLVGAALTGAAALTRGLPAPAITDAQITSDTMRPRYHLLPVRGWMNDPCGPIYWKGRYHMFFQYNPNAAVWGDMHWNHAVSPDMVRWQRLPIALAPTPGSADQDGCFTGTAVVAEGTPALLYTGVQKAPPDQATLRDGNSNLREAQCLAIAADDSLRTWRKLPAPVIPQPPPGMQVTGCRDPSPWRQGDTWYCVIASGQRGVGGNVLLYKSADLRTWQYLHPLAQGKWGGKTGANPVDTGEMWECPDFFPLDGKHVLIHSTEGETLWQTGTLDPATMLFHQEKQGILDHGSYYAPKTQLDAAGNRILWGWIQESRPQAEYSAAGWAGLMSLPRRLSLQDGELVMQPADQVATLRRAPRSGAAVFRLPSAAQEVRLTLEPSSGGAPFEQSFTDTQGAALLLRANSQQPAGTVRVGEKQISGIAPGPLDLHIFFDHSVAEVFVNHRHAVTQRYYQRSMLEPALAITVAGAWRLAQQQAWSLDSIWS